VNANHKRLLAGAAIVAASAAVALQAQNREWTTANGDAQRNSWVRTDPRLTKDAVQKGEFKFLWKTKLNGETRQLNSLTQPILLDRLISHRGFKALAFVGTSSERIFAIDTDLNRIYWEHVINYSSIAPPANSSWECPGGLTAAFTRPTLVAPPAFAAGRGAGRSGSSVGEPGRGAPSLQQQAGQAGRGRGNDPAPPAAGRANTPAAPQGRGAPSPGNGGGPTENVFVLASDGLVRALNTHNGTERFPAVPFVPANARAAGLILADGVLYTATSNGCGAVPNGVYALDVNLDAPKPVSWQTGGPSVAGSAGPGLGTDGTIYLATSEASSGPAASNDSKATVYASSVVALEPKTLKVKDWFTAPGADFNASPVVFRHGNKDIVIASGNDGRLYVLDGSSLGGSDHKTALHVTGRYTRPGVTAGVSTWEDQGTRWILAPVDGPAEADVRGKGTAGPAAAVLPVTPRVPPQQAAPQQLGAAAPGPAAAQPRPTGAIVAFKLVDQGGKLSLERSWASRAMTAPLTPVVFNGTVFAVSSGERRSPADGKLTAARRAQRSMPAILYALDPVTGKELWNSGRTITSFARAGLSASAGQVYLVTFDNTLYAFGIPMEH
jgi:outer membrane protein assembly factor BamB